MTEADSKIDVMLLAARVLVVAIFLWHGVPKALDPAAAVVKFEGFGLPGFLGPITGVVEVLAAIPVLLGVLYRPALAVLTVIIIGALVTVQIPAGVQSGLERDLLVLMTASLLFVMGPGRLRLVPRPT